MYSWLLLIILYLTFFKILTELEYSGVGRNKEQSARMLGHLVSNAPRLIRPYMEPILKVCVTTYTTALVKRNAAWNNLCCYQTLSVVLRLLETKFFIHSVVLCTAQQYDVRYEPPSLSGLLGQQIFARGLPPKLCLH